MAAGFVQVQLRAKGRASHSKFCRQAMENRMDEVLRRQSSLERNVMESLMKIQKNLEKRAGGEQFFGVQGKVVKLPSRHAPCLVAPSSHPDLPSIESRRLGGEGRHRPVFDSATPSQMPGGYMHPQVNDVHQGSSLHYVTTSQDGFQGSMSLCVRTRGTFGKAAT